MKKRLVIIILFLFCITLLTACGQKPTLNFLVDGKTYESIKTVGHELINMPTAPSKEDYIFDGWYLDNGSWQRPFNADTLSNTALSADLNVYAKFVPKDYYADTFYFLAEHIKANFTNISSNANSITYDFADCWTKTDGAISYSLNMSYIDNINSEDEIDVVFNQDYSSTTLAQIAISIPQTLSDSMLMLYTDCVFDVKGLSYLHPNLIYNNSNISFYHTELEGTAINEELESAKDLVAINEVNATKLFHTFMRNFESFISQKSKYSIANLYFTNYKSSTTLQASSRIIITEKSLNALIGEAGELNFIIAPYFNSSSLEVKSSNNNVISVDSNGNYKAIAAGSANITIKSGTLSKSISVVVREKNNVDLARKYIDNNSGLYYTLDGQKINSRPSVGTPYLSLDCISDGEYRVMYVANQKSYTKLDVSVYSIRFNLPSDKSSITDCIAEADGIYYYCVENSSLSEPVYQSKFYVSSEGSIANVEYMETSTIKGLSSYEKITCITRMGQYANITLNGLANILAVNADAFVFTSKTPTLSIELRSTTTSSATLAVELSSFYNEQITSAKLYKGSTLIKDCTSAFQGKTVCTVNDLLSNTNYTLKIEVGYNKHDGSGDKKLTGSISFTTSSVPAPSIGASITTTYNSATITVTNGNSTSYTVTSVKLYKNGSVIAESTNNGKNHTFSNILSGTEYSVKISYTYDLNDGNGVQSGNKSFNLKTQTYSDVEYAVTIVPQYNSVEYSISATNTSNINYKLKSIEVYKDEVLLVNLDKAVSGTIENLLANNTYELRITYSCDKNDGKGEQTKTHIRIFTTKAYQLPSFSQQYSSTYNSIDFTLSVSNTENVDFVLEKVDVISNEVVATFYELANNVSNLLSNTTYAINVYYTYNAQDGNGIQNNTYSFVIKTQEYSTPSISINNVTVGDNTIAFDTTLTDVHNLASFEKCELVLNDAKVAELSEHDNKVFSNLLYGNTYTIIVTYSYNKNDGHGIQYVSDRVSAKTYTKVTPAVEIALKSFNDESVTFDVELFDVDNIASITKVYLLVDGEIVSSIVDIALLQEVNLNGLQPNSCFTIAVDYCYNLCDGEGIHNAYQELVATNTKFLYTINNNSVVLTGINNKYSGNISTLEIPSQFENISKIEIQSVDFDRSAEVVFLSIPSSVSSLSKGIFSSFTSLQKISLPFVGSTRGTSGSTYFGFVFGGSSYSENANVVPQSLNEVIIMDDSAIAANAFQGCTSIVKVVVPDTVTSIGSGAFNGCNAIENITLPFVGASVNANYENAVFGYIFGFDKTFARYSSWLKNQSSIYASSPSSEFINDYIVSVNTAYDVPAVPSNAVWQYSNLNSYQQSSGKFYAGYWFQSFYYYIPTTIKNVTITVQTSIPTAAFNSCNFIETITLPTGTDTIGSYAFQNCSSLKRLNSEEDGVFNIPTGVASISDYAFSGCGEATKVTTGSTTNIGSCAFSGCSQITQFNSDVDGELNVSNGTLTIGSYAFQNLLLITKVLVPDTVTSIGSVAFNGCNAIENITLPFVGNSLDSTLRFNVVFGTVPNTLTTIEITNDTAIPSNAFEELANVTSITIPTATTSIGSYAFQNCSNLKRLNSEEDGVFNIPIGVASISGYAFSGCGEATKVTTGSTTNIGSYAFSGCSQITQFNSDVDGELNVSNGTLTIGSYAFQNLLLITKVVVPDTVTSIGSGAFNGCNAIENITLPFVGNSLDSTLRFNVVFGTVPNTLTTIEITNDTAIPSNAFEELANVTSITIPTATTSIGSYAFQNCSSLKRLNSEEDGVFNIPIGVASISDYAFSGCGEATKVTTGSTTNIGSYAFSGCSQITQFNSDVDGELNVSNGTLTIGSYAFQNLLLITKVVVPDTVTSMGSGAFKGCNAIENITLPFVGNSLTATNYDAVFGHIFGYTTIGCTSSSNSSDGSYHYGTSSSTAYINAYYKTIPSDTVWQYSCSNYKGRYDYYLNSYFYYIPTTIKNVTITVQTSIPTAAFNSCNFIETITLPTGTDTIGSYAFQNCSAVVNKTYEARIAQPWDGTKVATSYQSGDGTEANPYIIFSGPQLKYFADQVNGGNTYANTYFKLSADINLSWFAFPIIGQNSDTSFEGVFDGNNFAIKNLKITSTNEYTGLFGYLKGTVKNLSIEQATINSTYSGITAYVGSVAGRNDGVINNCYSNATITQSGSTNVNAGGFVGYNAGTITKSFAFGSVTSSCNTNNYTGGFLGYNAGSATMCYSKANVSGTSTNFMAYVGGFVGTTITEISDCYASGNVTAKGSTEAYSRNGGFVGYKISADLLVNCYRASEQVLTKYSTANSAYNDLGTELALVEIEGIFN